MDAPPTSSSEVLKHSPTQAVFDRFTKLVTQIFGVPVSLISIVEEHRQWFKSNEGLVGPFAQETPLSHSFCKTVVAHGEPVAVADAREHHEFRENLAVRDLGVVAYAGAPIHDEEGNAFAALCAISPQPRAWSNEEIRTLKMLAEQVTNEVALQQRLSRIGVDFAELKGKEEWRRQMSQADRHDLRTPLNSLQLSLQAVREFGPLDPDQAECLEAAQRSADEVLKMVDEMLDISAVDAAGREALHMATCAVAELFAKAESQVRPLLKAKTLELVTSVTPPTLQAQYDSDKMQRVIMNLLANAVKFTPAGGKVELSANSGLEGWQISVRDNGIGIGSEHLEKIFSEGYRVDTSVPTRQSAGVGLTFCKRMVEAHGGVIRVQSEPGVGTTFTLAFPALN